MDAQAQRTQIETRLRAAIRLALLDPNDNWADPVVQLASVLIARTYRDLFDERLTAAKQVALVKQFRTMLEKSDRTAQNDTAQADLLSAGAANFITSALLRLGTGPGWVKQWVTVGDDKVRPSHRAAAASGEIPASEKFDVGGHPMDYPGDITAPIEEWANCRCHPVYRRETEDAPALVAAATISPDGFVVVGLPATDDPIWGVSSEQPPHITMLYLSVDYLEQTAQILAQGVVTSSADPAVLTVTKLGELGDNKAQVAFVEPANLLDIRDDLMGFEPIAQGMAAVEQYPQWTPHLTLGYPDSPALSNTVPTTITIDRLAILDGDGALHSEYPLGEPMSDQPVVTEAPSEEPVDLNGDYLWEEIPLYGVLAPEDVKTGDKRKFLVDSLATVEPPLSLRWQEVDMPGHDGSVVTGHMDRIWREDGLWKWEGGASMNDHADKMVALVAEKALRGISVDLDDTEVEIQNADGSDGMLDEPRIETDPDTGEEIEVIAEIDVAGAVMAVSKGRIRSASVVAIPAFIEAFIAIGTWADHDKANPKDGAAPEVTDEVMAAAATDVEAFGVTSNPTTEDGPGWLTHPVDTDRLRDYWVRGEGAAKIGWGAPGDFNRCRALLAPYVKERFLAGYCFTGETEFLTRDGVTTFAEAVGTTQQVLTMKAPLGRGAGAVTKAGYWVDAPIESFGEQSVLSVTLRRNSQHKVIRATREHEWFASTDARSAARLTARKLRTDELRPGMALASLMPMPVAKRGTSPSPYGIAAGAVFGDGHRGPHGASIDLWGDKDAQLLRFFEGNPMSAVKTEGGVLGTRVRSLPSSWKGAPSLEEGPSYLLGWLAGYIAADGHVTKRGAISLSSGNRDHLVLAQTVANRLGISTLPITSHMRTGKGTEPTLLFKLPFVGETFPEAALVVAEHRQRLATAAPRFTATRWVVESVEDHGEAEEVFCVVVPETETFALADYVWVHNCANRHKDALGIWPGEHRGGALAASAAQAQAEHPELIAPAWTIVPREDEEQALVASGNATLLRPPGWWFQRPPEFANIDKAQPVVVTEEGRFYGYAAEWGVCHLGYANECVYAPQSPSNYAWFRLGDKITTDGNVPIGVVTIGTGHAPLSMDAFHAAAHYDNTGTVAAQIACGDDEFGIWVAGCVAPSATPEQIDDLRASKLSGDWREIGRTRDLDMVRVLAVNTPGFGIPRMALAASASGEEYRTALVAAGVVESSDERIHRLVKDAVEETLAARDRADSMKAMRAGIYARRRDQLAALAARGKD